MNMNHHAGTVLVTGASNGIGRALAHCFAAAGYSVILTGRDARALGEATAEIVRDHGHHGAQVTAFTAELGTEEGIAALLEEIRGTGIEIDVLVNNAGFGLHGNFVDHAPEGDVALTTVHVIAPWRLTKALLPGMVRRRRGGVLNVGSVYSFSPAPWQALYGAAKSWVLSFSLALREELRGTGVRVTALCPGTTLSRFRTRQGQVERPSWFTLTSAEVAAAGYRGFVRDRAVVIPGVYYKLYVLVARLLPTGWLGRYVYHTAYRMRKMPVPARAGGQSS
jgi:uncharacterized protein